MNPLRIALLTHSVNPRGGVMHTLELAAAFASLGHDVTIFVPAAHGETLFRQPACRVVYARITSTQNGTVEMVEARIEAFRRALAEHDAGSFDILHAQDSISGNALAELKAEGVIRGFVRTVHHLDHFDNPRLAAWQRRAYEDADQVLCVSETWAREMRVTYGVNATTVSNGVDVDRFRAHEDSSDMQLASGYITSNGPVVLAVGGIEARKNTLALVEAFATLRCDISDAQLVIAGGASLLDHDAYSRHVLQRAAELGLSIGREGSVNITGPLDDHLMPALFRRADVLAMVSLREGFGLVVLEALASGTPVVASKIAPFTEYLDERTCIWADPLDIVSIAAALRSALVSSHEKRFVDFECAVPELLARYSWTWSARRHLLAYEAFLNGHAAGALVAN